MCACVHPTAVRHELLCYTPVVKKRNSRARLPPPHLSSAPSCPHPWGLGDFRREFLELLLFPAAPSPPPPPPPSLTRSRNAARRRLALSLLPLPSIPAFSSLPLPLPVPPFFTPGSTSLTQPRWRFDRAAGREADPDPDPGGGVVVPVLRFLCERLLRVTPPGGGGDGKRRGVARGHGRRIRLVERR